MVPGGDHRVVAAGHEHQVPVTGCRRGRSGGRGAGVVGDRVLDRSGELTGCFLLTPRPPLSPAILMGPPGPGFCHGHGTTVLPASYRTTRRVLTPTGPGRLFDLHVLFAGMEVADDGVPGGRRD